MTDAGSPLLVAQGLRKAFRRGGRNIVALDGVDFTLNAGETLALVGPSGSGKSTLARIITRLIPVDEGELLFRDADFLKLSGERLRRERSRLQMVFQDPLAAFNPRATIERVLDDPLRIHAIVSRTQRPHAIAELLERVGLPEALRHRRIHEISGGQRQRVAIARAIATHPDLIILDEALSALDVSVRAQFVELLVELQKANGIAYLFISHDLGLVRSVAHRIAVLDAGKIVETGNASAITAEPQSPMARALVAAMPRIPSFEKGEQP